MKYLYIDDEAIETTQLTADLLTEENEELEVVVRRPYSFREEINALRREEYDGLILDLRLDINSAAEYRAFTLAQEIRTRATEGSMRDIPIVICSTDRRLKESYNKDRSGQNLFDKKYLKTDDLAGNSSQVADELVALARGYQLTSEIRSELKGNSIQLRKFFRLSDSNLELIDTRIFDYYGSLKGRLPVHEYVRFIFNELIITPGPLVELDVLSARLGVDKMSPDFSSLISILDDFKYKGPFGGYWERWWWPLVENWFEDNGKESISFLDAQNRIEILKKITKLDNLTVANAIKNGYSTKFWDVCRFYNQPLDPYLDGIILYSKEEPFPWQTNKYISIEAAINPESKAKGLIPHPIEKERVREMVKLLRDE